MAPQPQGVLAKAGCLHHVRMTHDILSKDVLLCAAGVHDQAGIRWLKLTILMGDVML